MCARVNVFLFTNHSQNETVLRQLLVKQIKIILKILSSYSFDLLIFKEKRSRPSIADIFFDLF